MENLKCAAETLKLCDNIKVQNQHRNNVQQKQDSSDNIRPQKPAFPPLQRMIQDNHSDATQHAQQNKQTIQELEKQRKLSDWYYIKSKPKQQQQQELLPEQQPPQQQIVPPLLPPAHLRPPLPPPPSQPPPLPKGFTSNLEHRKKQNQLNYIAYSEAVQQSGVHKTNCMDQQINRLDCETTIVANSCKSKLIENNKLNTYVSNKHVHLTYFEAAKIKEEEKKEQQTSNSRFKSKRNFPNDSRYGNEVISSSFENITVASFLSNINNKRPLPTIPSTHSTDNMQNTGVKSFNSHYVNEHVLSSPQISNRTTSNNHIYENNREISPPPLPPLPSKFSPINQSTAEFSSKTSMVSTNILFYLCTFVVYLKWYN